MDAIKRGEKALENLADFHKKQKEVEMQRRLKRNAEVDALIKNLGDPKVAEKLRIYRLVEDQFLKVNFHLKLYLLFYKFCCF